MAVLLFHLSDLHLRLDEPAQALVYDALVRTMERERRRKPDKRAAIVITGDVFDSAEMPAERTVDAFLALHDRMTLALGGETPTVVLPGNHDRRRYGILGPPREDIFLQLERAATGRRIHVAGCKAPFLAEIVPETFHGLPFHVVAYDSTYLPSGLIGAGGTLRVEDLLMVAASLPDDGRPLLLLTHHHLVPTPLTDVSHIDGGRISSLAQWALKKIVPRVVSYGDREELTMTAMGAGTILTTLHSFGRAVLLFHGHKHVPTARLVTGMTATCGDVLIASAGSAGVRERVHSARHPDAARLWPSFNLVRLSRKRVRIEALTFSPKSRTRPPLRRELAHAKLEGAKWKLAPVSFRVKDPSPRVDRDEASYALSPSPFSADFWDYSCERRVELAEGAQLARYVDFVHTDPRAKREEGIDGNRRIELTLGGTTRYEEHAGLCRTLEGAIAMQGVEAAFEWVGLLCRYGAARATLRLARKGAEDVRPFASLTDVTIGRERPRRIEETDDWWTVHAEACPPRSLLRIYWPLVSRDQVERLHWQYGMHSLNPPSSGKPQKAKSH